MSNSSCLIFKHIHIFFGSVFDITFCKLDFRFAIFRTALTQLSTLQFKMLILKLSIGVDFSLIHMGIRYTIEDFIIWTVMSIIM